MKIIWCMIPETWSMTDFFSHFGPFLPFYTPPPSPPKNPENQNFEKMKKIPGDIILHKCTKNHDHMLYCSWNMMRDGCNYYFSFWAIFCPSTPHNSPKNEIQKNERDLWIFQIVLKENSKLIIFFFILP